MTEKVRRLAARIGHRVPGIRDLFGSRDAFGFLSPGHFHSPIPSHDEVKKDENRLFDRPRDLIGIDLNEARQTELLNRFRRYYAELPFPESQTREFRYFYENAFYSYSDAIFLFCMLRDAVPRRVIEIGSGYSSCLILDTNERFMQNQISCTFIEPNPKRLLSLIRAADQARVEIIQTRVQDVDLARFRQLEENDILFVDSSHVAKIGSDVNYLFEEILPSLRAGVLVHFHDIFYPFEYPREWVYRGKAFNEAYVLRAFLAFNSAFEIVLFNTFLERFHRDDFLRHMPLCLRNEGGSIWLRRVSR